MAYQPLRIERKTEAPSFWEPGNLAGNVLGTAGAIVGGIYGGPMGAIGGQKFGQATGRGIGSQFRSAEEQAAVDDYYKQLGYGEYDEYKPWTSQGMKGMSSVLPGGGVQQYKQAQAQPTPAAPMSMGMNRTGQMPQPVGPVGLQQQNAWYGGNAINPPQGGYDYWDTNYWQYPGAMA